MKLILVVVAVWLGWLAWSHPDTALHVLVVAGLVLAALAGAAARLKGTLGGRRR